MTQTTPAPLHWKLVVDAGDPHAQADFWAAALHYVTEDNDALIQRLLELGALPREATVEYHARLAFRDLIAVRHPVDPYDKDSGTGLGRRLRFTELRREIDGVSQRMLTVTLRSLERDGLVKRTVHPVVPPRVEYELTPLGGTLHATIRSLVTWTEAHQEEIAVAREAYDRRAAQAV